MRRQLIAFVGAAVFMMPLLAQAQTAREAHDYNDMLSQYQQLRDRMSPSERADIEQLFVSLRLSYDHSGSFSWEPLSGSEQIGSLSTNPYAPMSTAAPAARYETNSPANPYSTYGSQYSTQGARNPYTTDGADIVGADGQYLGKLNSNPYDPNSVANPSGIYGSPYSATSVNNQFGKYGSPYSPYSANNPYAVQPPRVYAPVIVPTLPLLPSVQLPRIP